MTESRYQQNTQQQRPETNNSSEVFHKYQRIKLHIHICGSEAAGEPTVWNLKQLYVAYNVFYQPFYSQGDSAVPAVVTTENTMPLLNK